MFSSNRLGGLAMFVTRSDGSGQPRTAPAREKGFGSSGRLVSRRAFLSSYEPQSRRQSGSLIPPFDGDRTPYTFCSPPARETQGQFSRMARGSPTPRRVRSPEVYVRPLSRHRDQVAHLDPRRRAGAVAPRRQRSCSYLALDGRLMAVDIKASSSSFEAGIPHALVVTGITGSFVDRFNQHVVTRDGQRFLVNRKCIEDEYSAHHDRDELGRRAPIMSIFRAVRLLVSSLAGPDAIDGQSSRHSSLTLAGTGPY